MRVHPSDGNARIAETHPTQEAVGDTHHRLNARLIQVIEEFTQRHVSGDMDNFEFIGIQHHGVVFGLRQMRQHFGMPREIVPPQMQRLFVQRRGSNRKNLTGHCQLGGSLNAAVRQIPRLRLHFPGA